MNYSDTMYYDYFEKDHLSNVRTVLTDELQTDAYPPASMETAQLALEATFYSNMDLGVDKSTVSGYPSDTYTNPNDKIAKIRADTRKIGPGITLKVMAGDKFNFRVSSWYKTNGTVPTPPVGLATEIVFMMTHTVGAASGGKYTLAELDGSGAFIPGAGQFLQDYTTGYITSRPKAYVNWILYDEQFNYVSSSSGAEQVGDNLEFKVHVRNNMPIDRNGYLYVYTSTETANIDVFFDNLQVTHIRGPLLEEKNYYPFGLTMSGISSKALKTNYAENKNEKFQGQPLDDDLGLNWHGFKWRNNDPQIGRFMQIDPLSTMYPHNSTYAFSENKVTSHVEMEGLEAWPVNNDQGGTSTVNGPFLNQQAAQEYYNITYSVRGGIQPIDAEGFIMSERITKHPIVKTERSGIQNIEGIIMHRTVNSSANSTFNTFLTTKKGVHFVVDQDGTIYQIAGLNKYTVHVYEGKQLNGFLSLHNYNTIGIEHVGNYNKVTKEWDPVSDEMARASAWLVNSLMATYGLNCNNIYNHEQMQGKTAGEGGTVMNAILKFLNTTGNSTGDNNSNDTSANDLAPLRCPVYY